MAVSTKFTLVIDFDGTIVEHDYHRSGREISGSIEAIQWLLEQGHKIIIWTCRAATGPAQKDSYLGIIGVDTWLERHGLRDHPQIRVNTNHDEALGFFGCDTRKVFGHVYIDDRNLGGFPGWTVALETLKHHMGINTTGTFRWKDPANA